MPIQCKWPQFLVYGTPVNPDKAMEIIARIDSFFEWMSGNDEAWINHCRNVLGIDYSAQWYERHAQVILKGIEYLDTEWISSPFVFGPHGWIHPNGVILNTDNIGKWPSEDEVTKELQIIAKAFPFLDMDAVCMSGESCEKDTVPTDAWTVKEGTVTTLEDPSMGFHRFGKTCADVQAIQPRDIRTFSIWKRNERGVTRDQLLEIRSIHDALVKESK